RHRSPRHAGHPCVRSGGPEEMTSKFAPSLFALAVALAATAASAQPSGTSEALEKNFDALISSADQQQWLEQMSSEPNQVGSPHDYVALAARGLDVRGKIVLARYGGGWRGLKPKLAQEHGAIGCLIYSDPADDAYADTDVYPRGGGRPERGVQRGSVADMPIYPGDPETPGVGSVPGARRLSREQAITLLKIPT